MKPNNSKHAESSSKDYHGGEHHDDTKIHYRLHVSAIVEQRIRHGFVRNLSIKGATLFVDQNLQNIDTIKLQIHLPPNFAVQESPRVIEVSGKIIYSIYDSSEWQFRSGVNFDRFASESDREYLELKLASINLR